LACLKWLSQTLCSYAGYLGVSTLHSFNNLHFRSFIVNGLGYDNFNHDIIDDLFMQCTF
jgi:hypothetical protein